jgi:hypothetical protein
VPTTAARDVLGVRDPSPGPFLCAASVLLQKPIFNFCIDLVQPLFSALSLVLMRYDFSLQLRNTLLRGAKLMRELLSYVDSMFAVLLSDIGRPIEELQDRLSRAVELIDPSSRRLFWDGRKLNDRF